MLYIKHIVLYSLSLSLSRCDVPLQKQQSRCDVRGVKYGSTYLLCIRGSIKECAATTDVLMLTDAVLVFGSGATELLLRYTLTS